jgi:hypothetical protein
LAAAFAGHGSVIVLELTDNEAPLEVAKKIADEPAVAVTVNDADMTILGSSGS